MEELKNQLNTKEKLVKTLQDSLKLKDEQIETIKDSLSLKDEQIETLESSLDVKNQKIQTLEKSIQIKKQQLQAAKNSSVDKEVLEEKNEKINELEKKIRILNRELEKADEDFEKLEAEIEKVKKSSSSSLDTQIIDFTNVNIQRSVIIEKMKEIIQDAVHNLMIVVPVITDLTDLYLYEIRSSVVMKISSLVNPGVEEHSELLELESFDNISIRLYEGKDRFVVLKDGEELLVAVPGDGDKNYLVFHTSDPKHIKLFQPIVMETWLRSKKI
ncbi:MAG: hypothetical protein GF317_22530 [Candidatus Lokiarchaeota archaeon]|nr:hypothetical protein [Candidatus Lokiarchaeota archaeon]MBD3202238.1 hypothetical protein [Candidatus Lokiarchaeota archaeon]